MRLPRMTMRRWMTVILVMAVDFAAVVQRLSDPLATLATSATMAMMILAAPMLLLLILAADDRAT